MITHLVLFKLRRNVQQSQVERVLAEIAGLRKKIPGLISFSGGPYSSPEGLNRGYTHGFAMTFQDARARDAYFPHPEHEKVKGGFLEIVEGGLDGLVAFDFES